MKIFAILLSFAAVLWLMIYLLSFTNSTSSGDTYRLQAFFENTGGIKEGAPVVLVGKEIGKVESIVLDHERRGVKTTLLIKREVNIPNDSSLSVVGKGMLGEMYLSFQFGSSKKYYEADSELIGQKPFEFNELIGSAGGTVADVGKELTLLLRHFNSIFGDVHVKRSISQSLQELPDLMISLKGTVEDSREKLASILKSFDVAGTQAQEILQTMNAEVGKLQKNETMSHLSVTLKNTAELSGSLNEKGSLLMENLSSVGVHAEQALRDFQQILKDLNNEGGTAGKFIKNPALYDHLDQALVAARDLLILLEKNPSSIIWGRRDSGFDAEEVDSDSRRNKRLAEDEIECETVPEAHP